MKIRLVGAEMVHENGRMDTTEVTGALAILLTRLKRKVTCFSLGRQRDWRNKKQVGECQKFVLTHVVTVFLCSR